jgi:hypothetical protein
VPTGAPVAEPAAATRARSGNALLILSAVAAGIFTLRLLGADWPKFPPVFPDSFSYLKVARRGPFHPHFWFDERPPAYPLLLWLVARSTTAAVFVQTSLYVGAVLFLCSTARQLLSSRLAAAIAIAGFVAFALQPRFALWNTQILSESLSISLALFAIGFLWRAAARRTLRSLEWASVATAAWMLVRDSNVIIGLIAAAPILFLVGRYPSGATRRAAGRTAMAGVIILGVATMISVIGERTSHRDQYAVHNNIGMRILPNPELTAWFEARGMPISAALLARRGHNSWDDNAAFLQDPDLASYRAWAKGKGELALGLSALGQSGFWQDRLYREMPSIVGRHGLDAYDNYHVRTRLPGWFPLGFGGAWTRTQFFAWVGLALAAVALATTSRSRPVVAVFGFATLLSGLVEFYLSYIGDSMEVNRHLVGAMARIAVMTTICIALGVDRAVAWQRSRSGSGQPA